MPGSGGASIAEKRGRSFDFYGVVGLHVLVFGDSLQNINALNGTGGESVAVVGRIGFGVNY